MSSSPSPPGSDSGPVSWTPRASVIRLFAASAFTRLDGHLRPAEHLARLDRERDRIERRQILGNQTLQCSAGAAVFLIDTAFERFVAARLTATLPGTLPSAPRRHADLLPARGHHPARSHHRRPQPHTPRHPRARPRGNPRRHRTASQAPRSQHRRTGLPPCRVRLPLTRRGGRTLSPSWQTSRPKHPRAALTARAYRDLVIDDDAGVHLGCPPRWTPWWPSPPRLRLQLPGPRPPARPPPVKPRPAPPGRPGSRVPRLRLRWWLTRGAPEPGRNEPGDGDDQLAARPRR